MGKSKKQRQNQYRLLSCLRTDTSVKSGGGVTLAHRDRRNRSTLIYIEKQNKKFHIVRTITYSN